MLIQKRLRPEVSIANQTMKRETLVRALVHLQALQSADVCAAGTANEGSVVLICGVVVLRFFVVVEREVGREAVVADAAAEE
ncbi:MAG: hypothetical protein LQ343_007541, partial [Gyalolechia ehrenbergii]